MATAKKTTKKKTARNLGKATGVAEARKTKSRKKAQDNGAPDLRDVMHETQEKDALEVKLGEAASCVKRCHLLSKEATTRLNTARMSTSTPDAIQHDLERVVHLAEEIGSEAHEALRTLGR